MINATRRLWSTVALSGYPASFHTLSHSFFGRCLFHRCPMSFAYIIIISRYFSLLPRSALYRVSIGLDFFSFFIIRYIGRLVATCRVCKIMLSWVICLVSTLLVLPWWFIIHSSPQICLSHAVLRPIGKLYLILRHVNRYASRHQTILFTPCHRRGSGPWLLFPSTPRPLQSGDLLEQDRWPGRSISRPRLRHLE